MTLLGILDADRSNQVQTRARENSIMENEGTATNQSDQSAPEEPR